MADIPREPCAAILAAFLSGEASPSDAVDVMRWMRADPAHAARIDALQRVWNDSASSTSHGVGAWNADRIWNAIAPRLDQESRPAIHLVSPTRATRATRAPRFAIARSGRIAGWMTAAACAVLLIGVLADQRMGRAQVREYQPVQASVREYRTTRGQRASGTLPDGSAFQLGPVSVLRIPNGYGAPDRTVELEGDGYFNVTHDSQHPFSVRTARSTIRDIGTRFIVRARSAEARVEVAVADGKVAIDAGRQNADSEVRASSNTAPPLMVHAGQAALIDERGTATLLPHASVDARFAWTRGEFVFDHVLVPDVVAELGRWYGDTFVVADSSLRTVRLTTELRGETLIEALLVLETALDVDARVSGDTVTLTRHHTDKGAAR
jgi:ferric-dicitrate binding protein FerR (iron transport regulator)